MFDRLTQRDVERLARERDAAEPRIEALTKVVSELDKGGLTPEEEALARSILERFAVDAEIKVRAALAKQIARSPSLSRELAEQLASDQAEVAVPVLRHGKTLSDSFLLRVLAEPDSTKQIAIAERNSVSQVISEALVETDNVKAIVSLLRNPGADIAAGSLNKALERHGKEAAVPEAMAMRNRLPLPVVERLVHSVSEKVREGLIARYRMSPVLMRWLVARAREAATMPLIKPVAGRSEDLELFARHLAGHGRLSESLIFRALSAGELAFFVTALAVRAGWPVPDAKRAVFAKEPEALATLFGQAKLPAGLLPPFRSALLALADIGYREDDQGRRLEAQEAVVSRVLSDCSALEDPLIDDLLQQTFDQPPRGESPEGETASTTA